MKLFEFCKKTKENLEREGFSELSEELRLWLIEVSGKNSVFFSTRNNVECDEILSEKEWTRFYEIMERRKKREPLSYILGYSDFYGRRFLVREGVLTPRYDSEHMINAVLQRISFEGEPVFFYDLCTGSGCLAITVLLELQKKGISAKGYLTDISDIAISCAADNSKKYAVEEEVTLWKTDLLPPLEKRKNADFILSNPPYIPRENIKSLMPEVSRYEPSLALDGGADGLLFYRRILSEGVPLLKNGGFLFVEHGYDQGESVPDLFRTAGLSSVETIVDFGGNPRITVGRK